MQHKIIFIRKLSALLKKVYLIHIVRKRKKKKEPKHHELLFAVRACVPGASEVAVPLAGRLTFS